MSQQRGVLGTAAKESPRLFSCVLVSALATAQSVAFNSVSSLASTVAGEVLFLARRFFVLSIIFFGRFVGCRVFPFSDGALVVAVVVFLFSFLASFFFTELYRVSSCWPRLGFVYLVLPSFLRSSPMAGRCRL